jgi:hypothetical protein
MLAQFAAAAASCISTVYLTIDAPKEAATERAIDAAFAAVVTAA